MSSVINSGDKFKSDIMKMMTNGTSNDVKIVLEDGEILANKDVLCARSDYFATMFSNYKEVKFVEGETNKAVMDHCSKVIMEKIISYLFSGDMKLHDLSFPDLVRMMNMTSMMMLEDIYDVIEEYVLELIPDSGENCATLPDLMNSLILAESFGLADTKEALVQELFQNLKSLKNIPEVVQNSEAFRMMPQKLMKEILLYEEFTESENDDGSTEENIQVQEPKPKKKRMSKSKRAGLVFPILRTKRKIKTFRRVKGVEKTADVFIAAVLEYLTAEVLELAVVSFLHRHRHSTLQRQRIIPNDIYMAVMSDQEIFTFNLLNKVIIIPDDIWKRAKNGGVIFVECFGKDDEDDKDYDDKGVEEDDVGEVDEDKEDDTHDCKWVGDNDRFDAFLYWLSGNECSDEDRKEIKNSFDLLCGCFTAEKLLTDVRKSDLFTIKEIDDSVLEIMRFARKEMMTSEVVNNEEFCYMGMLSTSKDEISDELFAQI